MRTSVLVPLVMAAVAACGTKKSAETGAPAASAAAARGKMVLFDGQTLAGWDGDPQYWRVKDGAVSATAENLRGSFLLSKGDYGSFRLTLASRMVRSNNHLGVCMWGPRPDAGVWFPYRCILVIPPSGGMWDYNEGKGGITGQKVAAPEVIKAIDKMTWHTVEIVAHLTTGKIRAAFNGIEVVACTDPEPARLQRGPVALQLHGGRSPRRSNTRSVVIEPDPADDRLLTLKPGAPATARPDGGP